MSIFFDYFIKAHKALVDSNIWLTIGAEAIRIGATN